MASTPSSPTCSTPRKKSPEQKGRANTLDKTPSPSKRARAKKVLTKKAKTAIHFDEKWETHMMEHILQDTNLHIRMLRYEVIWI